MKARHSPTFRAKVEKAKARMMGKHPSHPIHKPPHRRPMQEHEEMPSRGKSQLDEMPSPPSPEDEMPENMGAIPSRSPKPTNQGNSQQGQPEEDEEENGY